MGSVYLRGKTWWLKYYQDGKPIRESSGSKKKTVALRKLKGREGNIAKDQLTSCRQNCITNYPSLLAALSPPRINTDEGGPPRSRPRASAPVPCLSAALIPPPVYSNVGCLVFEPFV